MSTTDEREPWEGWALVELMGHRKRAGHVTQEEVAGVPMLRLDTLVPDGGGLTTYYAPAAVYSITPVSESIARGFAARNTPPPVSRYELPTPEPPRAGRHDDDDPMCGRIDDDDDDPDDLD